jgi:hypothetical protein
LGNQGEKVTLGFKALHTLGSMKPQGFWFHATEAVKISQFKMIFKAINL